MFTRDYPPAIFYTDSSVHFWVHFCVTFLTSFWQRHEIYEEDWSYRSDEEPLDIEMPTVSYRDVSAPRNIEVEKKIIEPEGPRWTSGFVEGVGKTPAKWGTPRYEEIQFPWNKPEAKNPRTKGEKSKTGIRFKPHFRCRIQEK